MRIHHLTPAAIAIALCMPMIPARAAISEPGARPISGTVYADAEKTKSGTTPSREKWTGGFPGPTLADDLDLPRTPLAAGYASARPRLLVSSGDRDALRAKARDNPALWAAVLANARRVTDPSKTPTSDEVMQGTAYWRIECVQSAALAWFVTGEGAYRDGAIRWMIAHCRVPVWGTNYRPNLDLQASWYLYHLSIAYDLLRTEMTAEDARAIGSGLASHAKAIFDDFDPADVRKQIRYDQNHTYTPVVSLIAASLALLGEEPAAEAWLDRARAVLRRCRYALGEDGYYYEGVGYWTYALHWHARGAELLERATGENLMSLPALRDNWLYALHLSLPGKPWAFDVGDTGIWRADKQRPDIRVSNHSMLWRIARTEGAGEGVAAGDFLAARSPDTDAAASAFLWFDAREPTPLGRIAPYHYFNDHDVVAWRSGWGDDATAMLFRCGPPLGHAAAAKFGRLKDWTMNTGHVHADIGAFYLYAKGAYLAVGTGYTAEKWTRDQNTLLVDGKGQAVDGDYHNAHGVPYAQLDSARIEETYLSNEYGYVAGEFGGVYERQIKAAELRRTLLVTKRWMLVIDDLRMKDDSARRLTWLCHADGPFVKETGSSGLAHIARLPKAGLAVITLSPAPGIIEAAAKETAVMWGMGPGRGKSGSPGYHLELSNREPAAQTRFVNLLAPLGADEKPPAVENFAQDRTGGTVSFTLRWADGTAENISLDQKWTRAAHAERGPAVITLR